MNNARTIMHHLERIASAAGVPLDGDARSEIVDCFDEIDDELERLRDEIRAIRKQLPDNR